MGGRRALRTERTAARSTARRVAWWIITPLAGLTLVAMVLMWPGSLDRPEDGTAPAELSGTITKITATDCGEVNSERVNGCGTARLDLSGDLPDGVRAVEIVDLPNGPGAPRVSVGDEVLVLATDTPNGPMLAIADHDRTGSLWWLALAFVLAVVAFGRLSGVRALVGLAVTFGVLIVFMVPAILEGSSPVLVAVVGSAAIMLVVLYLTHGFSLATSVAVVGTLVALTLTGLLSLLALGALHLSGVTDDITTSIGMAFGVDMRGLLLAGIVIGSLGVLDDVTITQTATVGEVARANPSYGFLDLYRAGGRVGRAHVASVINTIVLAYAGSSLPLLLLLVSSSGNVGAVLSEQVVAQEIVRSIIGTLGIIAAIPVTTALAALVAAKVPDSVRGHGHGHTHAH